MRLNINVSVCAIKKVREPEPLGGAGIRALAALFKQMIA